MASFEDMDFPHDCSFFKRSLLKTFLRITNLHHLSATFSFYRLLEDPQDQLLFA